MFQVLMVIGILGLAYAVFWLGADLTLFFATGWLRVRVHRQPRAKRRHTTARSFDWSQRCVMI